MSVIPQTSKTYTGFIPTSIPNCALWFDAADLSTITLSSSNVTQWNDKSGNGCVASQSTAGKQATWTTTGIQFTSSTYYNITGSTYTKDHSLIFVGTPSSASGYLLGRNPATGGGPAVIGGFSGTSLEYFDNTQRYTIQTTPSGTYIAGYTRKQGGNIIGFYNGTVQFTQAQTHDNGTATAWPYINSSFADVYTDKGNWKISEIILYNDELTALQRQQLEGYLAQKWGLTANLPATHPFRNTPLYTRVFQPVDIPGCTMWLDAADSTTLTLSTNKVTAWNDKSGNGYQISQSNSAIQPTISTNALNGLNGIQFSTASYLFTASSNVVNFTTGTDTTIFFVAKNASTNAGWNMISTVWFISTGATNGTTRYHFTFNQATTPGVTLYANGGLVGRTTVVSPSTNAIVGFSTSSSSTNININGTLTSYAGVSLPTAGSTTSFVLGDGRNDAAVTSDIMIYEMIAFNTQLTTSQRQQVEGYLANKWGLRSNLPNTHPFRLYPSLSVQFIPINIPGCALWLDAADTSSNSMVLSGSVVTTWKDKSGNGYSGTSSGSPTIVSNGENGLSVVNFVSSSLQYFNFGDINDLGTNPFHIFIVSKFNSTASGTLFAKSVQGNSSGRYALLRESSTIIPLIESPGGNASGGPSDNSTSTRILTMFWNRSTLGLIQNGSSIASGTQVNSTNLNTTFPFLVGAYNNGSGGVPPAANLYFNGYMMEIIMYLGTITTSQRQQVEGYLAWKWGIQNSLVSSHSFRKIRP